MKPNNINSTVLEWKIAVRDFSLELHKFYEDKFFQTLYESFREYERRMGKEKSSYTPDSLDDMDAEISSCLDEMASRLRAWVVGWLDQKGFDLRLAEFFIEEALQFQISEAVEYDDRCKLLYRRAYFQFRSGAQNI